MSIKFTDIRPEYIGSETYLCPNECMVMHRELLSKRNLPTDMKGGSIASGGEVPFLVMLPYCSSLKVVDHNYGSLFWSMVKYLMLKNLTNAQIKTLMSGPWRDFHKFVTDVQSDIPLHKHQHPKFDIISAIDDGYGGHYYNADGTSIIAHQWLALIPYWLNEAPDAILNISRERLAEVEFVHGDIRDIGNKDLKLVYISNALGHSHHDFRNAQYVNGKQVKGIMTQINEVLENGGYLLDTSSYTNIHLLDEVAQTALQKSCPTCKGMISWKYRLLHKPIQIYQGSPAFRYYPRLEHKLLVRQKDTFGYNYDIPFRFNPTAFSHVRDYAELRPKCSVKRSTV